jgi:hypothetical protein
VWLVSLTIGPCSLLVAVMQVLQPVRVSSPAGMVENTI